MTGYAIVQYIGQMTIEFRLVMVEFGQIRVSFCVEELIWAGLTYVVWTEFDFIWADDSSIRYNLGKQELIWES